MLTDIDRNLLARHLSFYHDLRSGRRRPKTDAQRRFVAVIEGRLRPVSPHEVAFTRHLHALKAPSRSAEAGTRMERALDAAPFRTDTNGRAAWPGRDGMVRKGRDHLARCTARLRAGSVAAATALLGITADRGLTDALSRWSGESWNTLSNIYTARMDGAFGEGLQAGANYVSPLLHRLVDGNHTLVGSWEAVRAAVPDDTRLQEAAAWAGAFFSDLSSPVGMPVVTLAQESYVRLVDGLSVIGLDSAWVHDALHYNLEEVVTSALPALAIMLNWNAEERADAQRMIGAMGTSALLAANPLMALVLLGGVAREIALKARNGSSTAAMLRRISEGSVIGGVLLATSTAVGGPIWIGVVAALLAAVLTRRGLDALDRTRMPSGVPVTA